MEQKKIRFRILIGVLLFSITLNICQFLLITGKVPDNCWKWITPIISSILLSCVPHFFKKFGSFLDSNCYSYFFTQKQKQTQTQTKLHELPPKYNTEKIRILWIDDDPTIEDRHKEQLENLGLTIKFKQDLSETKDIESYHIICCDYDGVGQGLKAGNGGELIGFLRDRYYDKVIILVSSKSVFSMPDVPCDEFIQRGASFSIRKLAERIKAWRESYSTPFKFWRLCTSRLKNIDVEIELSIQEAFIEDYQNNNTNKLEAIPEAKLNDDYKTLKNACIRYINLMKS